MKTVRSTRRKLFILIILLVAGLLVTLVGATRSDARAGTTVLGATIAGTGQAVQALSAPLTPVGSGFTYQGQLKQGGNPANGQYAFTFALFDALSGGNQVGSTITMLNQTVTNGLFTVVLDFGSTPFRGDGRWLEIAVRQAGGGTYTTLSPRQALTAAPYARSLVPGANIMGDDSYAIISATNYSTQSGAALRGEGNSGPGVDGVSVDSDGVYGNGPTGVHGYSTSGMGVYAESISNWAIEGSGASGVWGLANATNGYGVYGVSNSGTDARGVWGASSSGWAGWFDGNVNVTGSCCGMGEAYTRIDDPLDPANKYLNQSLVESPYMKSIYDGNVTTDARGDATVALPAYFEAANSDFRYQLTVVGQFAQAIVSSKIVNNHFTIKTDKPSVEVSWQVTGIRKDPYAQAHPLQAETAKPADEQGKYLHPQELGQPESKGIDYDKAQQVENNQPPTRQLDRPTPNRP